MNVYKVNLPINRWWSDALQDKPYEHIEEILTSFGTKWTEIDVKKQPIIFITDKNIQIQSESKFSNDAYIKVVDDNDILYFHFHSVATCLNAQGNIIWLNEFVRDEWMSQNNKRYKNMIEQGTHVFAQNKHMDRFILGKEVLIPQSVERTIDYKQMPYLRTPNTSIALNTITEKQVVSEFPSTCPFNYNEWLTQKVYIMQGLNPALMEAQITPFAGGHLNLGTNGANNGYFSSMMTNNRQQYFPSDASSLSANWLEIVEKPLGGWNGGGFDGIHVGQKDGNYRGTLTIGTNPAVSIEDFPDILWSQQHEHFMEGAVNNQKGSKSLMTVQDIDDFYNLNRLENGLPDRDNPKYQYMIVNSANGSGTGKNAGQNIAGYAVGRGTQGDDGTWTFATDQLGSGSVVTLLVPIARCNLNNQRYGQYHTYKDNVSWDNWNGRYDTTVAFPNAIGKTANVDVHAISQPTLIPPSILMAQMCYPSKDQTDKQADWGIYNRTYDENKKIAPAILTITPSGHSHMVGVGSNGTIDGIYKGAIQYANWLWEYSMFWIIDPTLITIAIDDLYNKGIKFFTDFKNLLHNLNQDDEIFLNTQDNEPLLKCPVMWNLKYFTSKDGSGTLTADMLDWWKLETGGGKIGLAQNPDVPYNTLYRWTIEGCANPAFDFSACYEEAIFKDPRQGVSAMPSDTNGMAQGMLNGSFSAGGALYGAVANSMYKGGDGIVDGQALMKKAQENSTNAAYNSFKGKAKTGMGIANIATGLSQSVINFMSASDSINNQRSATISEPQAYGIPPFCADFLPNGNGQPYDTLPFATTYPHPYFGRALWSYHSAYGYIVNYEIPFDEVENRVHFNYIKIDGGWNTTQIIQDSSKDLSPLYNKVEEGYQWIDTLDKGLRVHHCLINIRKGYSWDLDDMFNIEDDLKYCIPSWNYHSPILVPCGYNNNLGGIQTNETLINITFSDDFVVETFKGTTELYNLTPSNSVYLISFSDDFNINEFGQGEYHEIYFDDGSFIRIGRDFSNNLNLYYIKDASISEAIIIFQNGNFQPSASFDDLGSWNLDIKTLTLSTNRIVSSNNIVNTDYFGNALASFVPIFHNMTFGTSDTPNINGVIYTMNSDTGTSIAYKSNDSAADDAPIWENGSFQPSHTWTDGTIWNLDTKQLSFPSTKTVLTNGILTSDYTGQAITFTDKGTQPARIDLRIENGIDQTLRFASIDNIEWEILDGDSTIMANNITDYINFAGIVITYEFGRNSATFNLSIDLTSIPTDNVMGYFGMTITFTDNTGKQWTKILDNVPIEIVISDFEIQGDFSNWIETPTIETNPIDLSNLSSSSINAYFSSINFTNLNPSLASNNGNGIWYFLNDSSLSTSINADNSSLGYGDVQIQGSTGPSNIVSWDINSSSIEWQIDFTTSFWHWDNNTKTLETIPTSAIYSFFNYGNGQLQGVSGIMLNALGINSSSLSIVERNFTLFHNVQVLNVNWNLSNAAHYMSISTVTPDQINIVWDLTQYSLTPFAESGNLSIIVDFDLDDGSHCSLSAIVPYNFQGINFPWPTPPSYEIYTLLPGDRFSTLSFSDDFNVTLSSGTHHLFPSGSRQPFYVAIDATIIGNFYFYDIYASSSSLIYDNVVGFAPSWSSQYATWNYDTKILTFTSTVIVDINEIIKGDYSGSCKFNAT